MLMRFKHLQRNRARLFLVALFLMSGVATSFAQITLTYSTSGTDATVTGCSEGTSASGELVIPATVEIEESIYNVTTIGDNAFKGCTGITSLTFGETSNVTTIGTSAFSGCKTLASVVFPNTLTTIGENAFYNCNALENVTFPSSVTTISKQAFCYCYGFTAIDIPNTVSSLGEKAFFGCRNLASVSITENPGVTTLTSTFSGCTSLTEVTVPDNITILSSAFSGCSALVTVNGGAYVTYISGFQDCSSLTTFSFPKLETIWSNTFNRCYALTSISLPSTLTTVKTGVFENCNALETITVAEGDNYKGDASNSCILTKDGKTLVAGCKNTVIPEGVEAIGDNAFYHLGDLTSIDIPEGVKSIGNYAFNTYTTPSSGNQGLTSLTLPSTLETIGNYAFNYNANLTEVTIPASVTSIGNAAFAQTGLKQVIMERATPPTLGTKTFYDKTTGSGVIIEGLTIYVPAASLDDYKAATNWSTYAGIITSQPSVVFGDIDDEEWESENAGGWVFIASPVVGSIAADDVENLIPAADFDLYRFNQAAEEYVWENYQNHNTTESPFVLENGKGYLYARKEAATLTFKGTFNTDDTKTVDLDYTDGKPLAGWNVVGNPFTEAAYANRSFYEMNAAGDGIEAVSAYTTTTVPPCTGIVVQTTAEELASSTNKITFSKTAPTESSNNGNLSIVVAGQGTDRGGASTGSTTAIDKAIVSFNAGDRLGKFYFRKSDASIYIPQGGKDYAIAEANVGTDVVSTDVCFKATKDGTYVLSVNPEGVELDYLHLIDNLTGNDVDLLAGASTGSAAYTFEAATTDNASRFRLVFSGQANGSSATDQPFAYYADGEIRMVETCPGADLQVVDMTGRIILCRDGACTVSTRGMTPGVYVLRLVNGSDVKTQKMVIE